MLQKITASKLKINLALAVTKRTIKRQLKKMKYYYVKVAKMMDLDKAQKKLRECIANSHPWKQIVFRDEKRFYFNGPDNWSLWVNDADKYRKGSVKLV